MFEALKKDLTKLIEQPQEYFADVCLQYASSDQAATPAIWAHRGLLLSRVPESFIETYMPDLAIKKDPIIYINLNQILPYKVYCTLIRFWYLAEINDSLPQQQQVPFGLSKLPGPTPDADQLIKDLKQMLHQPQATDVKLIHGSTILTAHRFLLACRSTYFDTILKNFKEAHTSTIHMDSHLFEPLEQVLEFLYTDRLDLVYQTLNQKRVSLKQLQRLYVTGDFLNMSDTLCKLCLTRIKMICHQFKCTCSDCAVLLPAVLLFSDRHELVDWKQSLLRLYSDPLVSIGPLWSQRPFGMLLSHHSFPELDTMVYQNMTKQNAVRVLSSIYICQMQLRRTDPFPTWSAPIHSLLAGYRQHTVDMIANAFEYYCVDYPVLLSCIDGIGFSVDFLGFLLTHVLKEGIHDGNAAVVYKCIVKDLMDRQALCKNLMVDGILAEARGTCVQYIVKRWSDMKSNGAFLDIEKDVLRKLAQDINVPFRNLTTTTTTTTTKNNAIDNEHVAHLMDAHEPKQTLFIHKRVDSATSLTDMLLAVEEPKKIRFSLPEIPIRFKTSEKNPSLLIKPEIGQKVELLRRPLPTFGKIKYIGEVEFGRGTWVGIELEQRLGNNDGSVDGKSYFKTYSQRGVFVKMDDFKIIE